MDTRAALEDVAAFFGRGNVTASDPKGPNKDESGFTPARKVLAAALVGLALVGAVAPSAAQAGTTYVPLGPTEMTQTADPVQGYFSGNDYMKIQFTAKTAEACAQKGVALAQHHPGWGGNAIASALTTSSTTTCMDAVTGKHLATINVEITHDRKVIVNVATPEVPVRILPNGM